MVVNRESVQLTCSSKRRVKNMHLENKSSIGYSNNDSKKNNLTEFNLKSLTKPKEKTILETDSSNSKEQIHLVVEELNNCNTEECCKTEEYCKTECNKTIIRTPVSAPVSTPVKKTPLKKNKKKNIKKKK